MEIIIDPRLKYNYATWYLLGIRQIFNRKDISFKVLPFLSLSYADKSDYHSGFAFILRDNGIEKKVFIDSEDVAIIFDDRYNWCDVYGMVNPTKKQVLTLEKLVPIGPECGIKLDSHLGVFLKCLYLYCKSRKATSIPLKSYLKDYLYSTIRRRNISKYEESVVCRDNYIFHASTLWYNNFAKTDTNKYRGEFLKACKKAGLNIEGGLFYVDGTAVLDEMPDYPKYKELYKDFIYDKRLSMDDYICKTKESVAVFNTPSVCECHGWKLAEYLCMGKAIISTPLTREMPGDGLIHGKNVHFVYTPEEIYEAVVTINGNKEYRTQLENGARQYYEQWLAPKVVVKRLIDKAFNK